MGLGDPWHERTIHPSTSFLGVLYCLVIGGDFSPAGGERRMFVQEPTPTTIITPPSPPREDIQGAVQSGEFLFYSAALALLLLAAGGVFYFVDRWRKVQSSREAERQTSRSMSSFREMYENGEITESEYRRLRDNLAAQLKVTQGSAVPVTPKNPFTGGKGLDNVTLPSPDTPPGDSKAK